MARQPAIDISIFFIVTLQAHPHAPLFVRQPVKVLDLPVAFPAGNFTVDMALMIEQDMLGYIVNLFPRSGGLGIEVFVLLLNPGVPFDDVVMAVQTEFHRRHSRKIGVGHIGVAILALNLLDTAVDVVAERYRLFRAYIRGITIKELEEENDSQPSKQGKEQRPPIAFQRYHEAVISGEVICH